MTVVHARSNIDQGSSSTTGGDMSIVCRVTDFGIEYGSRVAAA